MDTVDLLAQLDSELHHGGPACIGMTARYVRADAASADDKIQIIRLGNPVGITLELGAESLAVEHYFYKDGQLEEVKTLYMGNDFSYAVRAVIAELKGVVL
jgi:hypothetical protein